MANLTAKEVYEISKQNGFTVPKEDMDHILQRAKDGFFDAIIEPGYGLQRDRVALVLRDLGYEVKKYDTTRLDVSWDRPQPIKEY